MRSPSPDNCRPSHCRLPHCRLPSTTHVCTARSKIRRRRIVDPHTVDPNTVNLFKQRMSSINATAAPNRTCKHECPINETKDKLNMARPRSQKGNRVAHNVNTWVWEKQVVMKQSNISQLYTTNASAEAIDLQQNSCFQTNRQVKFNSLKPVSLTNQS